MKIFSVLLSIFFLFAVPATGAEHESTHEKVLRTGTLRCAYTGSSGYIRKDVSSGEVVGPLADVAREMAAGLSLKLEWAEEVGYADFAQGLKTGRYDAYCGTLSLTPPRARVVLFTDPVVYMPLYVYTRASETRFQALADMNVSAIKAGVIDGEIFEVLTKKHFPAAQLVSLPNMSPGSQLFDDLAAGKSDLVLHDAYVMHEYDRSNPGRVKIGRQEPLGVNAMA